MSKTVFTSPTQTIWAYTFIRAYSLEIKYMCCWYILKLIEFNFPLRTLDSQINVVRCSHFFPAPWLHQSAPQFGSPHVIWSLPFSASSLTLYSCPLCPKSTDSILIFQALFWPSGLYSAISLSWNSSFLSFCVTCCFLSLGSYFQCHPLLEPFIAI